ncbi:MAG TPA: ABC transporter ATP-binding protein [Jatrophihabitans sp.]|nr:ABC transporter ATP-binding protein [Jatrophihabitans sp.]
MTIAVAALGSATGHVDQLADVRLAHVSKRFGRRTALSDVGFEVGRGTVHGLLGPNGAGKTTLLRLLLGLSAPDQGDLQVLGRRPYGNPAQALAGVAGFVEAPAFYPYLSAQRNLDFLAGLDGSGSSVAVDEALHQVGLAERARDKVAGFSTGMKQRLGLAAALLRDPQLLILDEPTNGLDPEGMRELQALIASLAAQGRTVLLSSHDMTEIEHACSDVTILAAGSVRFTGSLAQLRAQAAEPSHALSCADNVLAAELASSMQLPAALEREELLVRASIERLDELVLALAHRGIAVRQLVRRDTALEELFLRLTSAGST